MWITTHVWIVDYNSSITARCNDITVCPSQSDWSCLMLNNSTRYLRVRIFTYVVPNNWSVIMTTKESSTSFICRQWYDHALSFIQVLWFIRFGVQRTNFPVFKPYQFEFQLIFTKNTSELLELSTVENQEFPKKILFHLKSNWIRSAENSEKWMIQMSKCCPL